MKAIFKDERLPEGAEVYVKGVGVFVNGKTVDLPRVDPKVFANDKRFKILKGGDDN